MSDAYALLCKGRIKSHGNTNRRDRLVGGGSSSLTDHFSYQSRMLFTLFGSGSVPINNTHSENGGEGEGGEKEKERERESERERETETPQMVEVNVSTSTRTASDGDHHDGKPLLVHGESVGCTLGRILCSRYSCWLCMAVAKTSCSSSSSSSSSSAPLLIHQLA